MRVVHPAFVFVIFINNFTLRKGEVFGRMQICPLDMMKGEFWLDQLEGMRTSIYVERAIKVAAQVESARLEDRPLPVQRAIGIIFRWSGCNAVALQDNAVNRCPSSGHGDLILLYLSKANGRLIMSRPFPFDVVHSDLWARNCVLDLTLRVVWTRNDQPDPVGSSCSDW